MIFPSLKIMRVFADFRKDHKRGLEPPANYLFTKNVPSGNPCAYVNMQLEIKPGTKKKNCTE